MNSAIKQEIKAIITSIIDGRLSGNISKYDDQRLRGMSQYELICEPLPGPEFIQQFRADDKVYDHTDVCAVMAELRQDDVVRWGAKNSVAVSEATDRRDAKKNYVAASPNAQRKSYTIQVFVPSHLADRIKAIQPLLAQRSRSVPMVINAYTQLPKNLNLGDVVIAGTCDQLPEGVKELDTYWQIAKQDRALMDGQECYRIGHMRLDRNNPDRRDKALDATSLGVAKVFKHEAVKKALVP